MNLSVFGELFWLKVMASLDDFMKSGWLLGKLFLFLSGVLDLELDRKIECLHLPIPPRTAQLPVIFNSELEGFLLLMNNINPANQSGWLTKIVSHGHTMPS